MSDTYLDALRLEPQPSAAYDNANTREEIAAVNRAQHDAARKRTKTPKGETLPRAEWEFLGEDHRRATARLVAFRPRARVETVRVAGVTITRPKAERVVGVLVCVTCGEEKPETKFPTMSGKPGVREHTCRECKQAAVSARKAGVAT